MPPSAERESQLLHAFLELADILVDDYDVAEVLQQLVERCVELLDAAAAGLLLSDQRGGLQMMASSSERARLLELFQLQSNEGPCLEAFRSGEPVTVADLSTEVERWPSFAPEAVREGFRSVHAVPLRLRRQTLGALNLFGSEPGQLDEQDMRVARALADAATIGILQDRAIRRGEVLTEQLQNALNSRITIEQAKGILAHAGGLEMDQAFELLRNHSRRNRARLGELAHQLATGTLHPDELLAARQ